MKKPWIHWTAIGSLGLLAACNGQTGTTSPTDEDAAVEQDLTSTQRELAQHLRAEVERAAERHEGQPNTLVALTPAAESRLQLLSTGSSSAAKRAALKAAGATERGAARVSGFLDSLTFRGIGQTDVYVILSEKAADQPVGLVVHSRDIFGDCTEAIVSGFDLLGTRVSRDVGGGCS